MSRITRGMALSAGLGTRLLPITEKFPKPVVPVLNVPNVLHVLFLFKKAGIHDVILNLHHLGDAIEHFLGTGTRWGMNLSYSREKILLGTGGGVKHAESFFEGKPFALANCDFVSDLELTPIIEGHYEAKALATMGLVEDHERHSRYSTVGVGPNGEICAFPRLTIASPVRTGIFTGVHILENEILQYLRDEPCGINEIVYPRLMKESKNRTRGFFLDSSYWYDTGDITNLLHASIALLKGLASDRHLSEVLQTLGSYREIEKNIWIPEGESLPKQARLIGPLVLGKRCRIASDSEIGPYVVVGDEVEVGAKARLSSTVALGGARVNSGETLHNTLRFETRSFTSQK